MGFFLALIGRTARLSLGAGGGAFTGLVFFLSVVSVVPFGVGPDMPLLARIGPAMLWIAALLATLLGLDRLFQDDRDDGTLDQLILSGLPLELVVLAKATGHWLATGLPLVIGTPVFGLILGLDGTAIGLVTLTLLLGTPALTFIGAIGAALITALRRGGLLVAVLVLPFTIPVLIFGVSTVSAATTDGPSIATPLLILVALSLASAVIGPIAGAAAIRAALD
ncbi:heme exporter protein CcmB [Kaistia dalseonensis]|uniref:Heme exporter protein B n=1 Tax=Kaistia dalseonensis TaxID=410840 RepID=A0ABU0H5D4_9HYPH|nr:heme exporter protein CcmB [Kaistia dalseonensis]MCX5494666.1 heme exporter protein CcmB [Kaistia dalseonensis]MDQ0437247.1 heme exporter protein B [Kaistia dalseonensis]